MIKRVSFHTKTCIFLISVKIKILESEIIESVGICSRLFNKPLVCFVNA